MREDGVVVPELVETLVGLDSPRRCTSSRVAIIVEIAGIEPAASR